MCVYWSSFKASANVDVSGPHQIMREIAPRMPKTGSGGNLEIDSWLGLLGKMFYPKSCFLDHDYTVMVTPSGAKAARLRPYGGSMKGSE
jgi:hypothetical protein